MTNTSNQDVFYQPLTDILYSIATNLNNKQHKDLVSTALAINRYRKTA
jgi:hypothetical protein